MRILFVNPYFKPYIGGIERIVDQVGLRLQGGGDQVGVLTTRVSFPNRVMAELPSRETVDGVEVFRCAFRPRILPGVFHASIAGYFSREAARVVRAFHPDVLHFTYSEWWGANLQLFLQTPRVPHVLTTIYHVLPHSASTLPLRRVNRWLVPRLDAVHTLSAVESQQVVDAYGARPDTLHVIPPGVDPTPVIDRAGRDTVTILCVGRLSEHKGQARLFQMFADIHRELPGLGLRLEFAGDDDGHWERLQRGVAAAGLDRVVTYLGRCTDAELAAAYARADVFALPTRYESFGLVFLEAMANGLPVITYDAGAAGASLRAGASVVPPGDEDAFRGTLLHLAVDRAARIRLGEAGRSLVVSSFSWDRTVEEYRRMYEGLLTRHV